MLLPMVTHQSFKVKKKIVDTISIREVTKGYSVSNSKGPGK